MVCFKTEPNKIRGFSQNRTETELEKSIPHIPNVNHIAQKHLYCAVCTQW